MYVCGCNRYSSKLLLYSETNWQTLENRRKFHRLILFFKIINDFTASHLKDILNQYINMSRRNLRTTHQYRIFFTRTECFKMSFYPNTIKDWNLLNQEVKRSTTIGIFKSRPRNELYGNKFNCNLYYYYLGQRKINSLLASMRMCCSSLKSDLYRNKLVNSATCECGISDETSFYFFTNAFFIRYRETHF